MSPESLKRQLEEEAEDIFQRELIACKQSVEERITNWLKEHEDEEMAKYQTIHTQLSDVQKQLKAIHDLFEQGKGALTVLKWIGYAAVAVWGVSEWVRDHIKF